MRIYFMEKRTKEMVKTLILHYHIILLYSKTSCHFSISKFNIL